MNTPPTAAASRTPSAPDRPAARGVAGSCAATIDAPRSADRRRRSGDRAPAADRFACGMAIAAALAAALVAVPGASAAPREDASWLAAPIDGNFFNAFNWFPVAVPTGTATFGHSFVSAIEIAGTSEKRASHTLGEMAFDPDTVGYEFALRWVDLTLSGNGIANQTFIRPQFTLSSQATLRITTTDAGSAGNADFILLDGSLLEFTEYGYAGAASFALFAEESSSAVTLRFADKTDAAFCPIGLDGAATAIFKGQSALALASIDCRGTLIIEEGAFAQKPSIEVRPSSVPGFPGTMIVRDGANLGNSSIVLRAGSRFIAEGGNSRMWGSPLGGAATIAADAGSTLDISQLAAAGIEIGALTGAGSVFIGDRELVLGTLGADGVFDGTIADGSELFPGAPAGGSVIKSGGGALALTGNVLTSGVAEIFHGRLEIDGSIESDIVVRSGAALGGAGAILATVDLSEKGSILSPGSRIAGRPAIGGFTINADDQAWPGGSIYEVDLATALWSDERGPGVGWDTFVVEGALAISAAPGSPIAIALRTVEGDDGSPAPLPDFDPFQPASWLVAGVIGPLFGFDAAAFVVDLDGFLNPIEGTFAVNAVLGESPSIFVNYIPFFPAVGDLNGDGGVDGSDLGLLLQQWGGPGSADFNGTGVVDEVDLAILLAAWG
ncbi:MAG TPA: hypothetical protein PKC43_05270 [Phycisphaerales bacterium]|nr:hypothetical protein [Phycisphaerales bacterium]HMP36841.1 hypothetical protein [Phycisphaerales bacterium]